MTCRKFRGKGGRGAASRVGPLYLNLKWRFALLIGSAAGMPLPRFRLVQRLLSERYPEGSPSFTSFRRSGDSARVRASPIGPFCAIHGGMAAYQDTRSISALPARKGGFETGVDSGSFDCDDDTVRFSLAKRHLRTLFIATVAWVSLVTAITLGVRLGIEWAAHDAGTALEHAFSASFPH
jgi:hypothetical protein